MKDKPTNVLPLRSRSKIEKIWGNESWDAFAALTKYLGDQDFRGPTSFREPHHTSYYCDPCDSVRALFSLSRFSADEYGNGKFDVDLGFWSKKLYDHAVSTDPWYSYRAKGQVGANEGWLKGLVPCLYISLSYMKWCRAETKHNPYWIMTTSGILELIQDFETLLMPKLHSVHRDHDLRNLMIRAKDEPRPSWVLSDRPGARRNLDLMIKALGPNGNEG